MPASADQLLDAAGRADDLLDAVRPRTADELLDDAATAASARDEALNAADDETQRALSGLSRSLADFPTRSERKRMLAGEQADVAAAPAPSVLAPSPATLTKHPAVTFGNVMGSLLKGINTLLVPNLGDPENNIPPVSPSRAREYEEQLPLYKLGDWFQGKAADILDTVPETERETVAGQLTDTVSSMALLASQPHAAPVLFGLTKTGEVYDTAYHQALEDGASKDEAALQAGNKALQSGAKEVAIWQFGPRALNSFVGERIARTAGTSAASRWLALTAQQGVSVGGTAAASTAAQNVIEGRPVGEDVGTEFVAGAVLPRLMHPTALGAPGRGEIPFSREVHDFLDRFTVKPEIKAAPPYQRRPFVPPEPRLETPPAAAPASLDVLGEAASQIEASRLQNKAEVAQADAEVRARLGDMAQGTLPDPTLSSPPEVTPQTENVPGVTAPTTVAPEQSSLSAPVVPVFDPVAAQSALARLKAKSARQQAAADAPPLEGPKVVQVDDASARENREFRAQQAELEKRRLLEQAQARADKPSTPARWSPPKAEAVEPVMFDAGENDIYRVSDGVHEHGGMGAPPLDAALSAMRKGRTAAQVVAEWGGASGEYDAFKDILEEIADARDGKNVAEYRRLRKAYEETFRGDKPEGADRVLQGLAHDQEAGRSPEGGVPENEGELIARAWEDVRRPQADIDREATLAAQEAADFEAFTRSLTLEGGELRSAGQKMGDVMETARGGKTFLPTLDAENLPPEYQQAILSKAGIDTEHGMARPTPKLDKSGGFGPHDWTPSAYPPDSPPPRYRNGFLGVVTPDGEVRGKWYADVTQVDHTEIGYRPHDERFRYLPNARGGLVVWNNPDSVAETALRAVREKLEANEWPLQRLKGWFSEIPAEHGFPQQYLPIGGGPLPKDFDPTILRDLTQLAGSVIEGGAIDFPSYAKAMHAALDGEFQPYYHAAYNQVRDFTEAATLRGRMTPREEIENYDTLGQFTGGSGSAGGGSQLPGTVGGDGRPRRPGLRVVDEGSLPAPRPIVRSGEYTGPKGHAIDETQRFAVNLALTAFEDGKRAFLLGDGTGVGKTGSELAIAAQSFIKTKLPSLIVTANEGLIETRFKEDATNFGIPLQGVEFATYDQLAAGKIPKKAYGTVIFDEAQKLKTHASLRSTASRAVDARHRVYATATPMDAPHQAAYFLAELTGRTREQVAGGLGFKFEMRPDRNGRMNEHAVLLDKEKFSWHDVIDNLKRYRNQAVQNGQLVRREYPFFGQAALREAPAYTAEQKKAQAAIERYWDERIARIPPYASQARRNVSGQKTHELGRWAEAQKIPHILKAIQEDVKSGKRVIVFAKGINDTFIKGLGQNAPGALNTLSARLDALKIPHGKVYGPNKAKKTQAVQDFQKDHVKVLLSTTESGGAGFDMDDVFGDRPRAVHAMTLDFSAEVMDQALGRVSRRNTASPADFHIWRNAESYADRRRVAVADLKLRVLRNIQAGEDLDTSEFERVAQNGESIGMVHTGNASVTSEPGMVALPSGGARLPTSRLAGTLAPPTTDEVGMALRAHHGSPHEIGPEGFQTAKIGTGEGAQVYGWGLYFAENPEVATQYRAKLGTKYVEFKQGDGWIVDAFTGKRPDGFEPPWFPTQAQAKAEAERLSTGGNEYTVSINAEPEELLDWDKPLSEQSEKVRKILEKSEHASSWSKATGEDEYSRIASRLDASRTDMRERAAAASKYLAALGIKGIRYLDQGSRPSPNVDYVTKRIKIAEAELEKWIDPDAARFHSAETIKNMRTNLQDELNALRKTLFEARNAPPPTYNYVIFDDKDITITHKNGQAVKLADAAAQAEREHGLPEGPFSFDPIETPAEAAARAKASEAAARKREESAKIAQRAAQRLTGGTGDLGQGDLLNAPQDLWAAREHGMAEAPQTPEFRRWFGDSKVVDQGGNPLVVYHGGAERINVFDPNRADLGVHFTTDERISRWFALHGAMGRELPHNGRITRAFLSLKNPLNLIDTGGFSALNVAEQLVAKGIISPERAKVIERAGLKEGEKRVRREIMNAGYDGVKYLNRVEIFDPKRRAVVDVEEYLKERGITETDPQLWEMTDEQFHKLVPDSAVTFIAFEPTQIKSATGNRGTFDPSNENIHAVPSIPAGGVADLPVEMQRTKPGTVDQMQIMAALENVSRAAGGQTPIRVGRFYGATKRAIYKELAEVVRIKGWQDIPAATHEIAHDLAKHVFGAVSTQGGASVPASRGSSVASPHLPAAAKAELVALGRALYGSKLPIAGYQGEGWAEYLRHWLSTEDAAKLAPHMTKWFENDFLPNQKAVGSALTEARNLIDTWRYQGAAGRLEAQSRTREPGNLVQKARAVGDFLSLKGQVENLTPLLRASELAAKKSGTPLPASEDPFWLATLVRKRAPGVVETMVNRHMVDPFGRVTGPSLDEAFATMRGDRKGALLAIYAKQALNRWSEGKNPGISRADAEQYLKDHDTPEVNIMLRKVFAWQRGVLDYRIAADPAFARVADRFSEYFYAPLARVLRAEVTKPRDARSPSNPLHRMKGSSLPVKDIIDQMLVNTQRMVRAADHALVSNAVFKLAQIEGMGSIIEKIPKSRVKHRLNIEHIREQLSAMGVDTKGVPVDTLLEWWTPAEVPRGSSPILVAGHGADRVWFEARPDIYEAVQSLDSPGLKQAFPTMPALGQVLDLLIAAPNRVFRLGTTGLRASFGLVTNVIRDAQTLPMQTRTQNPARLALTYPAAWGEVLKSALTGKRSPVVDAFYDLGAHMGQPLGLDIGTTKRATDGLFHGKLLRVIDPLRHPLDTARKVFGIPESVPRIAEMKAVLHEMGWREGMPMTPDQAVMAGIAAKRATVDFTAGGTYSRVMNDIMPFYNPAIQGGRSFARAFKEHPARTALLGLSMLTLPALINWYRNRDKEWWQALPFREKSGYNHVEAGGNVWQIARPFEWGQIFQAIPVALFDAAYQRDPEAFKQAGIEETLKRLVEWDNWKERSVTEAGKGALTTLNPVSWPTLLKVYQEQNANWISFWQRPIVPDTDSPIPAKQIGPYTSRLAIALGQALPGVSPRRVDAAIRAYFGGAAPDAMNLLGLGTPMSKREREASDMPVLGILARRGGEFNAQNQHLTDFYEEIARAEALVQNFRRELKRSGYEALADPDMTRLENLVRQINNPAERVELERAVWKVRLARGTTSRPGPLTSIPMLMTVASATRESAARANLYREAGRMAENTIEAFRNVDNAIQASNAATSKN